MREKKLKRERGKEGTRIENESITCQLCLSIHNFSIIIWAFDVLDTLQRLLGHIKP